MGGRPGAGEDRGQGGGVREGAGQGRRQGGRRNRQRRGQSGAGHRQRRGGSGAGDRQRRGQSGEGHRGRRGGGDRGGGEEGLLVRQVRKQRRESRADGRCPLGQVVLFTPRLNIIASQTT